MISLTQEIDTVIFGASNDGSINLFHSPKNFGGTRTHPTNKVGCLMGLGTQATCVQLDLKSALKSCNIKTPILDALTSCKTKEEFEALQCSSVMTFPGSAIFISAPYLLEAVVEASTTDALSLIPIAMTAAQNFDAAHENDVSFRQT